MKKEADKGFSMEAQTASPMTLNGKRIVVLGGTSGIGCKRQEESGSPYTMRNELHFSSEAA